MEHELLDLFAITFFWDRKQHKKGPKKLAVRSFLGTKSQGW